jgi:hypothetical protein
VPEPASSPGNSIPVVRRRYEMTALNPRRAPLRTPPWSTHDTISD